MKILKSLSNTKKLLKYFSLFVLSTVILLLSFIAWSNYVVEKSAVTSLYSSVEHFPQHDVALVLGTNPLVFNRYRNPYFDHRIEAAWLLYQSGKVKHFILSGDNGRHTYNEPEYMRDALLEKGVPLSAMTLDYAGFRTLDSVYRCKSVFGHQTFAIVSQQFHNERALFLAQSFGLRTVGFNAVNPRANKTSKVILREYLARAKAWLDVKVLGTLPRFVK